MTRHFLALSDFTQEEILSLLERAKIFKKLRREKKSHWLLEGKVLGLIFEKSSTRTRVSFETAMLHLGGSSIYMTQQTSQLGRGESYEDTARVLSRYLDGVVMRTFEQTKLENFAKASTIPVINGLTDDHHPCQVLADLLTVQENKGSLKDLKIVWLGDGNNMTNSWIEAALALQFELVVASPKEYLPTLKSTAKNITFSQEPKKAVLQADVINVDTWVSMGQEGHSLQGSEKKKKEILWPYQLNSSLLKGAKKDCIVLHCLPAHRGEEITDEVMDGAQSKIWDQAENRLHVQKALLEKLLT